MADPDLVNFIRQHLKAYGAGPVREQLLKDGVAPEEIDAAMAEAARPAAPWFKGRFSLYASVGGSLLLSFALALSGRKAKETPSDKGSQEFTISPDMLFRGHYGYMFKVPPGYEAEGSFQDAQKTREIVYIFPKGTDHTHFIDEGLYGNLGILRLEASPRRVPQGLIGMETLEAWVKGRLAIEKSTYKGAAPTLRQQIVHGMSGFVVDVSEPFASAKAYLIGQKVYYTLVGGTEDALFTNVLSSLIEVAPTDEPGK